MTQRDDIATALCDYYARQRIRVGDFACAHRPTCENFAKPRPLKKGMEAHVGHRYGEARRVVVVSLDSGNSSEDLASRTATIEPITPDTAGNPHMEGTAKFVKLLINPTNPPEKPMAFAAMLNSAKCAGDDGRMDTVPFAVHHQCRAYLLGELQILNPGLVWLQGRTVRDVLSDRLTTSENLVSRLRHYLGRLRIDNERLESDLGHVAHEYIHLLLPWENDHERYVTTVVTPHPSDRYGRWGLFERAFMPLVANIAIACSEPD